MNWPFLTDCKTDQSYPSIYLPSQILPWCPCYFAFHAFTTWSDQQWVDRFFLIGGNLYLHEHNKYLSGSKEGCGRRNPPSLLHDQVLSAIWLQHNSILCKNSLSLFSCIYLDVHPLAKIGVHIWVWFSSRIYTMRDQCGWKRMPPGV